MADPDCIAKNAPTVVPSIKMGNGYIGGIGGKFSDLANGFSTGYKNETTTLAIANFIEPPSGSRSAKIYVRVKAA